MARKNGRQSGKRRRLRMLEAVLRWMAVAVLRKYRPEIVGITGSIGKTSTKEAIALVLSGKHTVRKNEENYNNEIGIPLTIIGAKSGKRSVWKWLGVGARWMGLMAFPRKYPEILVLEMGIDRPGDMEYLLSFLSPKVGVLTYVANSHLEYFGTVDAIVKEKGLLLKRLPKTGTALVNADNAPALRALRRVKAKTLTYGFADKADIRAEQIGSADDREQGVYFRLDYGETMLPMRLPKVIARHHVPAVLAGVGVGLVFKMNLVDIAKSLEDFESLPGRMRLLSGVRGSRVVDDTYNASPASLRAAMETVRDLPAGRRVAVLGDMLELGDDSESAHAEVAERLREYGFDRAILVGPRMLLAYEALERAGWDAERIYWCDDPTLAGDRARDMAQAGDVMLVKGSQGMRMEKVVEALLADPTQAEKLLCRQSPDWKVKPFVTPG